MSRRRKPAPSQAGPSALGTSTRPLAACGFWGMDGRNNGFNHGFQVVQDFVHPLYVTLLRLPPLEWSLRGNQKDHRSHSQVVSPLRKDRGISSGVVFKGKPSRQPKPFWWVP